MRFDRIRNNPIMSKKISLPEKYLEGTILTFSETPCMFWTYSSRLIYTIILVQCCNLVALL